MGKTEVILISTLYTSQKIQIIDGKIQNATVPFTNFNGKSLKELLKYLKNKNTLIGYKKLS